MSISYPPSWIRIAGNSASIKQRLAARWRCYPNLALPVIPLIEWNLIGSVSTRNFIPGTDPDKDELGLLAWIDVYGILTIDEKLFAIIELKEP